MRKYLQLIVVLVIFFSAVFIRHLREPAKQPPPAMRAVSADSSSASLQLTPAQFTATPVISTSTPQPSPTVSTAQVAGLGPLATGPTATATPYPAVTTDLTPVPTPHKWPYLFEGSVFGNGAFIGTPARINYGELQIQLTMLGGRIEDIVILEYPTWTPTSERMSLQYVPRMVSQALATQDWDVDAISGATQTVQAFKRAMVYALRAAEQHG